VFVYVSTVSSVGALRPDTVYARVCSLKARVGPAMPAGWTPHWFGHSPCDIASPGWVPVHVVMRRLGHRNVTVETTLNRYGLDMANGWV
jgi:hypothetical protein